VGGGVAVMSSSAIGFLVEVGGGGVAVVHQR
jgi:hypothetical protein